MRKSLIWLMMMIGVSSLGFAQMGDILTNDGPGGLAITSFDRQAQRSIGGYFDTEFFLTDKKNSTFKAHRFILDVSSYVHENILVNAEIEFEYGGFVTNKDATSNVQQGEIKIEQAWVDYKVSDAFVQRTGIILMPFGRVNVLHDSDVRDATERPLYAKYIVPSTWMDTGAGFYGNSDTGSIEWDYQFYVVNGLTSDISKSSGIRSARPNYKTDNNGDKAVIARLGMSPFLGLNVAANFYRGVYSDTGNDSLTLAGFDVFYKTGRYEFVSEFAQASIETESGSDIPDSMRGGYVEARAHVLQSYLASKLSGFRSPVITLFTRFGFVDTDVDTGYFTYRSMVGFNFRPTESAVYKLEYRVDTKDQNAAKSAEGAVVASVAVGF